MAHLIILPKQGLQMAEGLITAWLKQEGDLVAMDEPLFEMETDKLSTTISATASGTLLKILHPAQSVVAVAQPIAVIGQPGEDYSALLSDGPAVDMVQSPPTCPPLPSGSYAYDVAVLGAGPGGYECAIRCAQYGLKVALIEAGLLGGTCLNRGCVPTKALLESAHLYHNLCNAKGFGVHARDVSYCYAEIAARKDQIVSRLRKGIEALEHANGVTVISGFGRLTAPHEITVGDHVVTARDIVLATGSAPALPSIPGIGKGRIMTSDEVLSLTDLPDSVVIIGGGVIGVEFATLLSQLEKKVTIVEMMPRILSTIDEEIAQLVAARLQQGGVQIVTGAKVLSFAQQPLRAICEADGKQLTLAADACIVSIGRRPQTMNLGLETLGVELARGFVRVDAHMQTTAAHIYAIGDITGKQQLAHAATAHGMIAAASCAGVACQVRAAEIPSCIYTSPEIACVGMTTAEAEASGRSVRIGRFDLRGNAKTIIMGTAGIVKLVSDARSGEILGCQIYGPRATDMIGEIVAVMRSEGTVEELAAAIHPHPTVCEAIMEAAHDTHGQCCNALPRCAPRNAH